MTTAAASRRESARGNGTTGGQFGFQDHTPPAAEPSAAWPGTNRNVRDHDFVPASTAEWPGLYGTEGQGSGLGGKQFVAHYSGPGTTTGSANTTPRPARCSATPASSATATASTGTPT